MKSFAALFKDRTCGSQWFFYTGLFLCSALLLIYAYQPAFHAGLFVIDDALTFLPVPKGPLNFENLHRIFSLTPQPFYIPVMYFSFFVDSQLANLFHTEPLFFMRLANIAYLSLSVLLVASFFLEKKVERLWAATTAILFAVHPLHTIPTLWLSSRKDVLVTLFLFLTVFFKRRRQFAGAFLAFALALGSKQSAYSLLIWLVADEILFRYYPAQNQAPAKKRLKPFLMWTLPFVALVFLYMPLSMQLSTEHPSPMLFLWDRTFLLLQHYFGKVLWPLPITQYYPRPPQLPLLLTLLSWVFILVVFFIPWFLLYKKKCGVWTVSVWMLGFALIEPYVIMVPGVHFVNNAYMYGLIGPVLLLFFNLLREGIRHLARWQKPLLYIVPLLSLSLIPPTLQYDRFIAAEFTQPVLAFERNATLYPNDFFVQTRLGYAALAENNKSRALKAFETALRLRLEQEKRISVDAFDGMMQICIDDKDRQCLTKLGTLAAQNNRPFYCFRLLQNPSISETRQDGFLAPCWQRFAEDLHAEEAQKMEHCQTNKRNPLALENFKVSSCL